YSAPMPVTVVSGGGTQDVNIKQVNGHTVLEGAGASGNGSQRETVAQDTTTVAGSAPGTAGTPSAQWVSVRGVAGGAGVPTTAAGVTASGASLTENPLADGCRGASAAPTAVRDGQKVNLLCPLLGQFVNMPYAIKELDVRGSASGT